MTVSDDDSAQTDTGTEHQRIETHTSDDSDDSGEPTVLIVDDESDIRILFESYLEDEFNVITASSGPEALELIDNSVDVVLLDRRMPDMTGDQTLGLIREQLHNVQVAMVTAVDPTDDIMDLPFDAYILKEDIDEDSIKGVVRSLIQRREHHRQAQQFFRLYAKAQALDETGATDLTEYQTLRDELEQTGEELNSIINEMVQNISANE